MRHIVLRDLLPPPTLTLKDGGFLGHTSERQHDYQAIPVCPTVLDDGLGDTKYPATFIFDVDCGVFVPV